MAVSENLSDVAVAVASEVDTYESGFGDTASLAADKGMVSVIDALNDADKLSNYSEPKYETLIEIAREKAPQIIRNDNMDVALPGLGAAASNLDSEGITAFFNSHGDALKTALEAGDIKIQGQLDSALVTVIKARTAELEEKGSDNASSDSVTNDIVDLLLNVGASAEYNNYAALKATNGNGWLLSPVLTKLANSLDDKSEKTRALNFMLKNVASLSYASSSVEGIIKAGANVDEAYPNHNFLDMSNSSSAVSNKSLPVIAGAYEDQNELKEKLTAALYNASTTMQYMPKTDDDYKFWLKRVDALAKAGADITGNDYQVVKDMASYGCDDALETMLSSIGDSGTRTRIRNESIVAAVDGLKLNTIKKLTSSGEPLNYNALIDLVLKKRDEIAGNLGENVGSARFALSCVDANNPARARLDSANGILGYLENKRSVVSLSAVVGQSSAPSVDGEEAAPA